MASICPNARAVVPRRGSRITVPARANPLAKLVFDLMRQQAVTYHELEMRSGVLTSTFKAWRTDNSPGLASIEAALGSLGWGLVPVPHLDTLPEPVRAKLEEISLHFRSDSEAFGMAIRAAAEWPTFARVDHGRRHKLAPSSIAA